MCRIFSKQSVVGEGAEFSDGTVVLKWFNGTVYTRLYSTAQHMEKAHEGYKVVWLAR